MKNLLLKAFFFAFFAGSTVNAQTLIHYWNFNDETSVSSMLIANETIGDASINHLEVAGISAIVVGTGGNFEVENLNAQNSDVAGSHLRFNDPIGGGLEFILPTTDFEDIEIKFATRRSGSGAGDQLWYYSTDGGVNYTLFTTVQSIDGNPILTTLDFSVIAAANNNAEFRVKVEFAQGGGGIVGNNRFDNFTVSGVPFGTGGPSDPTLSVSTLAFDAFNQTLGFPSSPQELTVSGANLTSDIVITSSGDFEISFNGNDNFSTSLELPTPLGFIVGTPIFVRLNANSVGNSTGTLALSTSGADDILLSLEGSTNAPQTSLLYYWHFNTLVTPTDVTEIESDYTLISGFTATLTYTDPVEGNRDIDAYSPGSTLNAQMGATQGAAARVRNPSAMRSLSFDVPTTGAENIVFTYAVQRSNNGALTNTIEYALDGVNFITTGLSDNTQDVGEFEIWNTLSYDFSTVSGANDNPNFKIRIIWEDDNASNPSGNNRYDNITITGTVIQDDLNLSTFTKTAIQVYPNPALDVLHIQSDENIEQLFIFDGIGALVRKINQANDKAISLNTNDMAKGVYTLLVQTTSGYSQIKFIKK